MLSNTCEPHIKSIRAKGIFRLFDVEIFSCNSKIDAEKPGTKIYRQCLKALGLKANECVFIDDSRKNVAAARKLGMKSIHFKDARQLKAKLGKIGIIF